MTPMPPLEHIIENLEHLGAVLGKLQDPRSIKVIEDCYTHNLEALHHYRAWDELRHYMAWFKDYKGVD